MTHLSRRTLLRRAFFAAASLGSTSVLPGRLHAAACLPLSGQDEMSLPTGPLADLPPLQPPNEFGVAVPPGFNCRLLAQSGESVPLGGIHRGSSAYRWHTFPDGGAVFPRPQGGWVYTSNSEIPVVPLGGCGALSFDAQGEIDDAYAILQNTTQNCAGGPTPWQTWISCEESKDGLCYECDPFRPGQGTAKPALGRFAHEAVAFDSLRNTLYLTEDTSDGRFYRWTADATDYDNGRLGLEQGRLEVMNLLGYADDCYPQSDSLVRKQLPVEWAPVDEPLARQDKLRARKRNQRRTVSGTVFAGGEGLWSYRVPPAHARHLTPAQARPADMLIFWTTKLDNRVWMLDVANQTVELIFDNETMDSPIESVDNLTVSPWGDILVAEDPPRKDTSRLVVLLPNRGARTLLELHHPGSEICGPAFTPDGSRLYFSSQRYRKAGATFELRLPPALIPG